jgi:pimeloyl-ACP methyl ester carboxylesterase
MTLYSYSTALALVVVGVSVVSYWKREQKPISHSAQREIELKVSKILELIQNDQWSELRQNFTPILRFFLTAHVLKKGWQLLSMTTGPVQSIGNPTISSGWITTVKVPVSFKRCSLAMILQMTPNGGLCGLRFAPLGLAGLGPVWTLPPYAIVGSSRQENLKLGEQNKVEAIMQLPKEIGIHPCVIFLAGSGPTDKDSTMGVLKPFADLALGLSEQGVASIRFDKVTRVHPRRFRRNKSFTLADEYMDQASGAIQYAQDHAEVDKQRLYILGHSLGAVVAVHIASTNPVVKGCIIMAGPAKPMYHAYIRQLRYFASLDGEPLDTLQQIHKAEQEAQYADSPELSNSTPADCLPFGLPASYWINYHALDPVKAIANMDKPVLCLQGSRDYQVDAVEDYGQWISVLEKKRDAELHLYEGLNHAFVRGEGQPTQAEYDVVGNVDEVVIRDVSRWVLSTR